MNQGVVRRGDAAERRERETLQRRTRRRLAGRKVEQRLRNFRPDAASYFAALGGPLPYMTRLRADRRADPGARTRSSRTRGAGSRRSWATTRAASPRSWRTLVDRWSFDEVNDLISRHNRWYPVESRLPMDPRTGDYARINGEDFRRRAARRRVGAGAVSAPAAARRSGLTVTVASSVARQSAAASRYGTASPKALASAPPPSGPSRLPSAQAEFMIPKPSPWASPADSARSETSAIPGV